MKVGVPDLVSPSYFPAIAAVELGYFADEGIDAELELLFPVTDAAAALRDGHLSFLAGTASAPFYAFPDGRGAKLLCALSQHTYWFLVVRSDLGIARGDLAALHDLYIGAAPGVAEGLEQTLIAAGIDIEQAGITIAPVPGTSSPSVSFGVTAAEQLAAGRIDGFWANGMGADVALRDGSGTLVFDARRDGGPSTHFTFASLWSTDRLVTESPEQADGAVRAIIRAHEALRENPDLARVVGERVFPPMEAGLIAPLVERDLPYYDPAVSDETFAGLIDFAGKAQLLTSRPSADDLIPARSRALWHSVQGEHA
jgi:ABC-type nitrate/sulfonate/bicarbonate transport system substrate-binding protein